MDLVVGVDSSTQATKVEIRFVEDGRPHFRGSHPHPPVTPPTAEQDPESWWRAYEDIFKNAMASDLDGPLAAISVAGQQHGCVVTDASGVPLRPAKLWNDTTTAPDAAWLVDQLPAGAAGWAQACGSVPVAAFTISKLSWLHRTEPELWSRVERVCLPHDWLTWRLSGELVTDRGDASGTGYWSPSEERYRTDLLEIVDDSLDWAPMLPRVLGPIEMAGQWLGAVVGPGTGDNMAAALGLGIEPGDVVISLGTSGTVSCLSSHATADPSGSIAGFADANGAFLPLACTLNATKVTDTVAGLLGVDLARLDLLARHAEPGAAGLTLLPYLDGERTPNRPTATGVLAGLRTDAQPEQVARAAVEGVVCGLLDGLDALRAHVPDAGSGRLFLTGGGARSAAYRQVLADLAQREVTTTDLEQTVATGACVQAAAVLTGRDPAEVRAEWDIASLGETEPSIDAAIAEDVRSRYAARRDREA
ncbi:MAG TPA: xylulokinase [Microthrixaceae bacterium]|nr:xylulokinase [Microthrixaceae bacterium]